MLKQVQERNLALNRFRHLRYLCDLVIRYAIVLLRVVMTCCAHVSDMPPVQGYVRPEEQSWQFL